MHFDQQEAITAEETPDTVLLEALGRELSLLRKAVLRQGHAQELFQARVEEAVGRLSGAEERADPPPPPELAPQQFARIHRAYQLLTSPERRMEVARTVPEETIDQLFPVPATILKAPPPPPPALTGRDLEPLAPFRRTRLVIVLREAFADGRGSGQ